MTSIVMLDSVHQTKKRKMICHISKQNVAVIKLFRPLVYGKSCDLLLLKSVATFIDI